MKSLDQIHNYLSVRLLGKPELRWRGHLLSLSPKLQALLFYLVIRAEAIPRGELEELLWAPRASHSLRQALYQLRSLPGAERWLLSGEKIAVEAISDLAIFETLVARGHHKEALDLWPEGLPEARQALLWGFELERVPAFVEWLEVERARVEMLYLGTVEHWAIELEQSGAQAQALEWVDALLRADPLNESAYRLAIRLCYRLGQPEAAFAYFERCRRALLVELGTAPLEETLSLAHGLELPKAQSQPQYPTLREALERLPDPRSRQGRRYSLATLLGLVIVAFLGGAHSLHQIIRFGQEHPELLDGLGFPYRTPPGRSALAELLHHLNPNLLQKALYSVVPIKAVSNSSVQTGALELLETWTLEVRYRLQVDGQTAQTGGLLERFGWSGPPGSQLSQTEPSGFGI
jgi:DNA-binding SARP family transcriptional activator